MNKCKKIFRRCLSLFGYGNVNEQKIYMRCANCGILMDKTKMYNEGKLISLDKNKNNLLKNAKFCKAGCLLEIILLILSQNWKTTNN